METGISLERPSGEMRLWGSQFERFEEQLTSLLFHLRPPPSLLLPSNGPPFKISLFGHSSIICILHVVFYQPWGQNDKNSEANKGDTGTHKLVMYLQSVFVWHPPSPFLPPRHPDPVCAEWRESFSQEHFLRAIPPLRLRANLLGSLKWYQAAI